MHAPGAVHQPANMNAPDAAGAGRAWPSRRTWDMAARLQTAAEAGGAGELVTSLLVRGGGARARGGVSDVACRG